MLNYICFVQFSTIRFLEVVKKQYFGSMGTTITTQLHIPAPVETVWEVLLDFTQYPNWNPFIPFIEGKAVVGERLTIHVIPPGTKGMRFNPVVTQCDPLTYFAWKGSLGIPGLFEGHHQFQLIAASDTTTTFIHKEDFKGILLFLLSKSATLKGFEAMNTALYNRVLQKI